MNGYDCGLWLWSATDRQTPPPTPPPNTDDSDDDGRAYIYLIAM